MGVPGLFSWVRRNYPGVVQEKTQNQVIEAPKETCDHLYIGASPNRIVISFMTGEPTAADLNHILHSCAHSLGLKPDEGPLMGIFHHIEQYLDWLISVAKPQKLCLLAVDGVAPKAKLVQQRTRRFLGVYRRELEGEIGNVMRRSPNAIRLSRCRTRTATRDGETRREEILDSVVFRSEHHHTCLLPHSALGYLYRMWLTGDALYGRTNRSDA